MTHAARLIRSIVIWWQNRRARKAMHRAIPALRELQHKAAECRRHHRKGAAKYECGTAAPYKTEQLVTKKGDPGSHTLHFPAPPNTACWQSVAASPAADAGAPDAGGADDAGAAATDAGAEGDAGAGDAGDTDAGDAGTTDAGSDAGAAKAR